ncbi:uncharacterized protein LOC111106632 [Crassostrea virginica]
MTSSLNSNLRYSSWEDVLDGQQSAFSGYVNSEEKLEEVIDAYEYATLSRFCVLKSSKSFGRRADLTVTRRFRFCDPLQTLSLHINFDGIPYFSYWGRRSWSAIKDHIETWNTPKRKGRIVQNDDTQHDRHHHFIKDPEKVYQENYMKYCFGDKYITPEGFEYLQNILDERMCANKLLLGSIFSRYATFCNCSNKKLEQIFIAYPLMGRHYFERSCCLRSVPADGFAL